MILSTDAGLYSLIAFQLGHPSIPLARLATALTQTWIALVVLLPLPILLFPDGKLPSRRWRWSFWLYVLFSATFAVATAVQDSHAFTDKVVHVDSSGELKSLGTSLGFAATLFPAIYGAIVLSWVIGKIVEYRRSTGERRQPAEVADVWRRSQFRRALPHVVPQRRLRVRRRRRPADLDRSVGILKYRLYDIDRLISRTLSYAIVTGCARRGVPRPGRARRPTCCRSRRRSVSRRRRSRRPRCSIRCAGGFSVRSTVVSTAPATTQRRPSVRSPGGCATRSTSRRSQAEPRRGGSRRGTTCAPDGLAQSRRRRLLIEGSRVSLLRPMSERTTSC